MREEILDWVPEERARYTWLGAIAANTGVLAAFSMLVFLAKAFGVPWPLLLPVAAFWGWVIFSFDAWLISGMHGAAHRLRWLVYLPRLALALLIGTVIAEPLLLQLFQTAIHREVHDARAAELTTYESLLQTCNPKDGSRVDAKKCKDHRLTVANSPEGIREKRQSTIQRRNDLQKKLDDLGKELGRRNEKARQECNGTRGGGLTGRAGEGPNCRRNRAEADQFRADSRMSEHQAELLRLNKTIDELNATAGQATESYGREVTRLIKQKVDARPPVRGPIGVLEEIDGLDRLSGKNAVVGAAQWLVRLLLVALELMPILSKWMSGTTTYDRLVTERTRAARELHDRDLDLLKSSDSGPKELRLRQLEQELRGKLRDLERADEATANQEEEELNREIDELAARLRREEPLPPEDERPPEGERPADDSRADEGPPKPEPPAQ